MTKCKYCSGTGKMKLLEQLVNCDQCDYHEKKAERFRALYKGCTKTGRIRPAPCDTTLYPIDRHYIQTSHSPNQSDDISERIAKRLFENVRDISLDDSGVADSEFDLQNPYFTQARKIQELRRIAYLMGKLPQYGRGPLYPHKSMGTTQVDKQFEDYKKLTRRYATKQEDKP